MSDKVTLIASDGTQIVVERRIAIASKTIEAQLTELSVSQSGAEGNEIAIPQSTGKILKWIVEWSTYYVDHIKEYVVPEQDKFRSEIINPWDRDFISRIPLVDPDQLSSNTTNNTTNTTNNTTNNTTTGNTTSDIFGIFQVANYLEIVPLVHLCAKTIANLIKQMAPEDLKQSFGITPIAKSDNVTTAAKTVETRSD